MDCALSMEFSRQEYWSGLRFPCSGGLPDPGIKPRSPAMQVDSLMSEPPECALSFGLPWRLRCKESSCIARNPDSIPGLGRSPREVNGYLLHYSCLENSMGRGAWQVAVHILHLKTFEVSPGHLRLPPAVFSELPTAWLSNQIPKQRLLSLYSVESNQSIATWLLIIWWISLYINQEAVKYVNG